MISLLPSTGAGRKPRQAKCWAQETPARDWTNYSLQDTNGYELANVKMPAGMLVQAWHALLNEPSGGNLKLDLKDGGAPDDDMPFTNYFRFIRKVCS